MTGLPTCKSCPFVVKLDHIEGRCHYWPPMAQRHPYARRARAIYPPVGLEEIGCARHPQWPHAPREVEILKPFDEDGGMS